MKKTMILETLAAALFFTAQAHAAPISLDANTVIAGTYQGSAGGILGLDGLMNGSGGNVTHIDGTDQTEFLTADPYLFGFDFSSSGLVTVYANSAVPALRDGDLPYTFTFDFGNTLPAAITGFSLKDASQISGAPALTVINGHTIGLDLGQVTWNSDFADFTAQLESADAGADVPEPASLALVLLGAAGLAGNRKRNARTRASRNRAADFNRGELK